MKALHYPTYASYREHAEQDTLQGIGESITFYRERLAGATDRNIKQCYTDALRAYEDELLSREYCLDSGDDDPFFEDSVREYEPGDLIDFGC